MPELSHIDPGSAVLLVMDYKVDALTKFMTAAQSADAIACVPDLIAISYENVPAIGLSRIDCLLRWAIRQRPALHSNQSRR
jgi:hypothetical protein